MAQWNEGASAPTGGNGSEHPGVPGEAALQERIEETMEAARRQLDEALETAADFVRQRPVVCLAGAVALGFLVGKLASRR